MNKCVRGGYLKKLGSMEVVYFNTVNVLNNILLFYE